MSSQSRHSISSRPQALDGNTTGAIGEGPGTSQFRRRAHARPVNIPERRLWSHGRPMFYMHDSSGSSQGGSSTKGSGSGSTTSEGREGRRVHTVSPYGSFFVEDMEINSPADSSQGGGRTRGTTADLNRVIYQTSARRSPPWSQNNIYRQRSPIRVAPTGLFETTEPTYFGMPGALPAPSRNVTMEGEGTPSTLTTSTHRSQSNQPISSWNREYRNHSNSPHNSRARPPRVVRGTALPPGSSMSNPDREMSRRVTRTTWRK
jgi:hypothetical protein